MGHSTLTLTPDIGLGRCWPSGQILDAATSITVTKTCASEGRYKRQGPSASLRPWDFRRSDVQELVRDRQLIIRPALFIRHGRPEPAVEQTHLDAFCAASKGKRAALGLSRFQARVLEIWLRPPKRRRFAAVKVAKLLGEKF